MTTKPLNQSSVAKAAAVSAYSTETPAQPQPCFYAAGTRRAPPRHPLSHNTSRASGLASLLLSCNSSRDTEERAQPRDYLLNLLEKQNWVLSPTSPSCRISRQNKQTKNVFWPSRWVLLQTELKTQIQNVNGSFNSSFYVQNYFSSRKLVQVPMNFSWS